VRNSNPTILTTVFAVFPFITVSRIGYTARKKNTGNDKFGVPWLWDILGYRSRTSPNRLKKSLEISGYLRYE
jgi:hypothetical protein